MSMFANHDPLVKELDNVSFSDFFTENTKKTKRNLILASFAGIISGSFPIKIEGFGGFKLLSEPITSESLNGMIFCITIYYIITFGLYLVTDLLAWNFKKEIVQVKPYIGLLKKLSESIERMGTELENANSNYTNIYSKIDTSTDEGAKSLIRGAQQQIVSVYNNYQSFESETLPDILESEKIISTISKLKLRIFIRFITLFSLDILFPILFGALAILKTHDGITIFINNIIS